VKGLRYISFKFEVFILCFCCGDVFAFSFLGMGRYYYFLMRVYYFNRYIQSGFALGAWV
jgi:hypothetical protein